MSHNMAQTFTGRRRIRKFFGHLREVAEMPNLIEVQKASYDQFLLVDEPRGGRPDEGLQAVFKSVFPISDFSNAALLEFVKYEFEPPKYDVDECRQRGMTFAAPLKVTLRLIVFDVDPDTAVGQRPRVVGRNADEICLQHLAARRCAHERQRMQRVARDHVAGDRVARRVLNEDTALYALVRHGSGAGHVGPDEVARDLVAGAGDVLHDDAAAGVAGNHIAGGGCRAANRVIRARHAYACAVGCCCTGRSQCSQVP